MVQDDRLYCANCGEHIPVVTVHNKRFCNDRCNKAFQNRAYLKRKRSGRVIEDRTFSCRYCSKVWIVPNHGQNRRRKYCDGYCQQRYWNSVNNERAKEKARANPKPIGKRWRELNEEDFQVYRAKQEAPPGPYIDPNKNLRGHL